MNDTDVRLILITGGARSGKSQFAEAMARHRGGGNVACVVTLDADRNDEEMTERIERHRRRRARDWQTIEAPRDLRAALEQAGGRTVLLDCLTVWLGNQLERCNGLPDEQVVQEWSADWLAVARRRPAATIVVTNEVGAGLVPLTPVGRRFRDLAGRLNQIVADAADQVWLCVAGQPLRIKPDDNAPSWWTGRDAWRSID